MQFKIIAAQDLDKINVIRLLSYVFLLLMKILESICFYAKAIHVVGILNNQIVSHALWTDRVFTINGSSDDVKTAYVEYVTTDYTMR